MNEMLEMLGMFSEKRVNFYQNIKLQNHETVSDWEQQLSGEGMPDVNSFRLFTIIFGDKRPLNGLNQKYKHFYIQINHSVGIRPKIKTWFRIKTIN